MPSRCLPPIRIRAQTSISVSGWRGKSCASVREPVMREQGQVSLLPCVKKTLVRLTATQIERRGPFLRLIDDSSLSVVAWDTMRTSV